MYGPQEHTFLQYRIAENLTKPSFRQYDVIFQLYSKVINPAL